MPQDIAAEKKLLGMMMIDVNVFDNVADVLREEMFYASINKDVYHAMVKLRMKNPNCRLDFNVIELQMIDDKTFKEGETRMYLLDLFGDIYSTAAYMDNLSIIIGKYQMRRMIELGVEMVNKGESVGLDFDQAMDSTLESMYQIISNSVMKFPQKYPKASKEPMERIRNIYRNGETPGLMSGFKDLDAVCHGFQPGDLVIFAARPAMGKTSFALCLALNMIRAGQPVAFFSLEMNTTQIVNRLLSMVSGVDGTKLNGGISGEELEQVEIANEFLMHLEATIHIDDTPGMQLFELQTKARQLVRTQGVKCVIIDYLQLLNLSGERFSNRQEEVAKMSRMLKNMAKSLDVPVVALAQLNRNNEMREGKRPILSDLRESGAIEQDADIVSFLHRPEYYRIYQDEKGRDMRGLCQVLVAKNRKGATGDVNLKFESQLTRFSDYVVTGGGTEGMFRGANVDGGTRQDIAERYYNGSFEFEEDEAA